MPKPLLRILACPGGSRFLLHGRRRSLTRLASEGAHPDVIVVDPPRKGCDNATLAAIVQMAPRTLVMVSCNPSTAARDAKFLCEQGYTLEKVQPVDLFPRTKHVECVLQMTRKSN